MEIKHARPYREKQLWALGKSFLSKLGDVVVVVFVVVARGASGLVAQHSPL